MSPSPLPYAGAMALLNVRYYSSVLGLSTTATVILPQAASGQIGMAGAAAGGRLPTLYLLHGLTDDDSIWQRRTSIERYVAELPLAVVMPTVHRGWYTDQADGYRYFTHIADELPQVMGSFFPLSQRREDTYAAGLSMGGYGAFKLALRRPERFGAAASLSGALDVGAEPGDLGDDWRRTFSTVERSRENGDDLIDLVHAADPTATPRLWAWCGTEDFLLPHNHRFRDAAADAGVGMEYHESPGTHEWGAWDREIQRVLAWLPLSR